MSVKVLGTGREEERARGIRELALPVCLLLVLLALSVQTK